MQCDQVWGASSGTRASEKPENCAENGSACLLNTSTASRLSKIISLDKFSSLPKLFRVTAYVIRFKNKLLRLIRKDLENVDIGTKDEDHTEFITAEELLRARSLWIRDVQHEYLITDEKTFDSLKKQLKLFCDQNGLWRCGGGRINNAELNYDMKYPYILPKSKFAELLVMNSHTDVKHNGVKETLNNMRKEFWITRSRNYIKKILHSCHLCKYMEGKSYKYPESPPLPEFRVCKDFAYSYTGVDYAGPFYVKNIYVTLEKNVMFKCWLVLFTCANSRSIIFRLGTLII